MSASADDETLLDLLRWLDRQGYRFVPPTPETHKRVVAREWKRRAATLRDIFGWSLPFDGSLLPRDLCEALLEAGALHAQGDLLASKFRVASVEGRLFLHSAFPTVAADSVFLGPDSYRFVRFLVRELGGAPVGRLVDIGAGAGVGAITVAGFAQCARVTLTDINPAALRLARVNARHAGLRVETLEGPGLDPVEGPVDLVIANPPFIVDSQSRAYRDGGGMHGSELSLEWTTAASERLAPGGRMLLYTGSAIVAGTDALETALRELAESAHLALRYEELDPDIFGEELDGPAYRDVERIAAVGAVISRRG